MKTLVSAFEDESKIPALSVTFSATSWFVGFSWNPRQRVYDTHYDYFVIHLLCLCVIASWRVD